MEQRYGKKFVGTSVFALAIAMIAFSFIGLAQATHDNGNGQGKGHVQGKGHIYGGQPTTLPPGQVDNPNSNRQPNGNGRGK